MTTRTTICAFYDGGSMSSQQYEGIPLGNIADRVATLLDGAHTVVVHRSSALEAGTVADEKARGTKPSDCCPPTTEANQTEANP